MPREIRIEGWTEEEILAIPPGDLDALVLSGEPVVFRAGTATILGEFRIAGGHLQIELAQIEGGGEGVLLALGLLSRRVAQARQLKAVEWTVHAVHCAQPNLKLRRVLELRGFVADERNGVAAYRFLDRVS